jgi:hypothetical protein
MEFRLMIMIGAGVLVLAAIVAVVVYMLSGKDEGKYD